eukprot:360591-Chlamydomonas_euryale.AAC.14
MPGRRAGRAHCSRRAARAHIRRCSQRAQGGGRARAPSGAVGRAHHRDAWCWAGRGQRWARRGSDSCTGDPWECTAVSAHTVRPE